VLLRRLSDSMSLVGINAGVAVRSLRGLPHYLRNKRAFEAQYARSGKEFPLGRIYPCLWDRFAESGTARGQYFHQDLHVAQRIFQARPARHVDVGSRVDGFVAHLATFMNVEVMDLRPMRTSARNIAFRQLDLMEEPFRLQGYCESLSCLHTLEHFGLGRYGDRVDYYGYRRGWENLTAMLGAGGKLYFSVPIGPQRVEFDGHRVFAVPFIVDSMIGATFRIDSLAYVDDSGEIHFDADPAGAEAHNSFGTSMGCAIFELTKR
jgi:hypothetical protein